MRSRNDAWAVDVNFRVQLCHVVCMHGLGLDEMGMNLHTFAWSPQQSPIGNEVCKTAGKGLLGQATS